MDRAHSDLGIIQAILERFETQRLPRLLSIEKSVDAHQLLNDSDVDFLKTVITDTRRSLYIVERNQDYLPLVTKVIALYIDITSKALQLEEDQSVKSM